MSNSPDADRDAAEIARLRYELQELVATSRALSSERDTRKLLDLILRKCREVTGADAGSVYIVEGEGAPTARTLHFMLSQNDSMNVNLQEFRLPVDEHSIVGQAVLDAQPINIPDLEMLTQTPSGDVRRVRHNRTMDDTTGYRTRSLLTVPMLSARGEVMGVVQLINRKRQPSLPLSSDGGVDVGVIPFDARAEEFALALASQAGIALENTMLYEEIRNLFDGFVDASVTAIESRDPTTSGHSRRVATLTVALARHVDAVPDGPLRDIRFSQDDLRQIEYAGMLHDFGKVGVKERVLVKAKKLYPEELREIELRLSYALKAAEARAWEEKCGALERLGATLERQERWSAIESELAHARQVLQQARILVKAANEPSVLEEDSVEKLLELAHLSYVGPDGDSRPCLEPHEVRALQVKRGSLTALERAEIESHVVHTFNFLSKIPWGRSLRNIPRIAGAHHEYLSGDGYPGHRGANDIPVESRMMTIADIFDALTASDRPYKKAVPVNRALEIVHAEVKTGRLDASLFDVFVKTEVYKTILSKD